MRILRTRFAARVISFFLLPLLLIDPITINSLLALTSGPNQPEFSVFEPVATTDMVNEFTGQFTYNLPVVSIPGPEGSGYSLSLSYHSGTSPEEEASWVGYGWTLNAGAIVRNKRGLPDDYNGENVTHYNDVPNNWTISAGVTAGEIELFGSDALSLGLNSSLRYNNYSGFSVVGGTGFKVKGIGSLGLSFASNEATTFNYDISPIQSVSKQKRETQSNPNTETTTVEPNSTKNSTTTEKTKKRYKPLLGQNSSQLSKNWSLRPTKVSDYSGTAFNFSASLQANPSPTPTGAQVGVIGSFAIQIPTKQENAPSYGYLYSAEGQTNANGVMDYYSEKESPFSHRDLFLSIPFSNKDYFNVLGEGIGGTFSAHNRKSGHFFTQQKVSLTSIDPLGVELMAGGNTGGGGDLGSGSHTLSNFKWAPEDLEIFSFDSISSNLKNETSYFRFNNDLGGSISFGNSNADRAEVVDKSPVIPNSVYSDAVYHPYNSTQQAKRNGRANYIGFHTNNEMKQVAQGTATYTTSYTRDETTRQLTQEHRNNLPSAIGEFSITNEDGFNYTYGIPVYASNEHNLHYGFKKLESNDIVDRFIAYKNIGNNSNIRAKVGEVSETPYATSYLLTTITSTDYIDRNLDGPTEDDFGSYTKFSYDQHYSHQGGNLYHWRIPYTGLYYNPGELSNKKDNMTSYLSGDKEIYYLQRIDTKTHYAVFVTALRKDGISAANDQLASYDSTATGGAQLKYLKKIELYAKSPDETASAKLIQTTHFDYDEENELMPNLPNSISQSKGKLTLKRVYTTYEGTHPVNISPYVFDYNYPDYDQYPTAYREEIREGYEFSNGQENPPYSPFNLDPWGQYQANGNERYHEMRPWVSQKSSSQFDPAAWQLKQIHLPSGGRIDIQYEQQEYLYVQNRRAMAMVRLLPDGDNEEKFFLDINQDLGTHTTEELYKLAAIIRKEIIQKKEKIYFKFLYSLLSNAPSLDDDNCVSEFFTGYAKVQNVGIEQGRLFIKLVDANHSLPKHLCNDYKKKNKGRISPLNNCNSADQIEEGADIEQMVRNLLQRAVSVIPSIGCKVPDPEHSYFRIPLLKPKKGGGIRVKRLLMYDKGLENQAMLFGKEYLYQVEDPITKEISSSGVATNEPPKIREECTLIRNLQKRTDQGWFEKIIAGPDKDKFEGLIGETILPSASIGYRKVTVKNIHTGRTNPGFTVNNFHTVYDYPFDRNYGNLKGFDKTELHEGDKQWALIPAGLFSYSRSNLWLTQGYSFVQTSFHGKPKNRRTYTGNYMHIGNPDLVSLSSAEEYEYFQPNEKIPILKAGTLDEITLQQPGKEMEVIFEGRKIDDISTDFSIEADASVSILGLPLPFITAVPSMEYSEQKLHTHVTTKVTSIPCILKKTIVTQDGVRSTTENIAFSPENCRPVITKTTDGYHGLDLAESPNHDGSYYNYSFPASNTYAALQQKAKNERRKFIDLQYANAGNLNIISGFSGNPATVFHPGDLIVITIGNSSKIFHVNSIQNEQLFVIPHSATASINLNSGNCTVEILESGHSNRLNENVGSLTTYGHPVSLQQESSEQALLDALNEAFQNSSDNPILLDMSPPFKVLDIQLEDEKDCSYCDLYVRKETTTPYSPLGVGWYKTRMIIACQFLGTARPYCEFHVIWNEGSNSNTFGLSDLNGNKTLSFDNGHPEVNGLVKRNHCIICEDGRFSIPGVIDANVLTYTDQWDMDNALNDTYGITSTSNPYETGAKGKWRAKANYVYREAIIHGNDNPDPVDSSDDSNRNYNQAGTFTLNLFDWLNLNNNDPEKWLRLNQTTLCDPNGQVLEEEDIRGIKSTAKYGYNHNLPYLIAQNANYESVCFESFENLYGNFWEDGFLHNHNTASVDSDIYHSGNKSLRLNGQPWPLSTIFEQVEYDFKPILLNNQSVEKGVSIKLWLRDDDPIKQVRFDPLQLQFIGTNITKELRLVAHSGRWVLYEVTIEPEELISISDQILRPKLFIREDNGRNDTDFKVWIDDFRIQPLDAQMTCYVYDTKTYRLLTSFDDQHFGLYYQYNDEGKLIRKLIETERGMKTVQETQYNTPKTLINE